jgi:hypothetical protein
MNVIAIYISPNQTVNITVEFINENFAHYNSRVCSVQPELTSITMILSGDFNIDCSIEKSKRLLN